MAEKNTSMNMEENVASLLCYLGVWVTGIIFFFLEKNNKTVKFHAMQSIIVFLPLTILGYIFMGLLGISYSYTTSYYGVPYYGIPTLSPFYYVGVLIYLVMAVLWLILMFKAYKGEKFN